MAQILVIDADYGVRAMLRLLLEDAGYTVMTTCSPERGMAVLRTAPESMVVLFDSGIPRVQDGRVTALAMANEDTLRRHAYICLTTHAALIHPDLYQALLSLAVPIVEKPFDLDALLVAVSQAASRISPRLHSSPE
jgi:DNA-binding NtrC family response regulator